MREETNIQSHLDLKVWQLGMDIAERVYKATDALPDEERFGLTSQLRRAAVSIRLASLKAMPVRRQKSICTIYRLPLGP